MAYCSGRSHVAVLYTIPFSPYSEAARWALSAAKFDFVEVPYLPGVHLFFSPIARLRSRGQAPGDYTGTASTAPLLMGADGGVLGYDSWQCIGINGSTPPSARVKELLDTVVGPCARTIFDSYLLVGDVGDKAMLKLCSAREVPSWQRLLFGLGRFRQTVKGVMYKELVISSEHVESCRAKLRQALTELEPLLEEEPYIGPTATAAGIACASLLALVLLPPEFCISFYGDVALPLSEMPSAAQDEFNGWRRTSAGKWAMDYYAKHRVSK